MTHHRPFVPIFTRFGVRRKLLLPFLQKATTVDWRQIGTFRRQSSDITLPIVLAFKSWSGWVNTEERKANGAPQIKSLTLSLFPILEGGKLSSFLFPSSACYCHSSPIIQMGGCAIPVVVGHNFESSSADLIYYIARCFWWCS